MQSNATKLLWSNDAAKAWLAIQADLSCFWHISIRKVELLIMIKWGERGVAFMFFTIFVEKKQYFMRYRGSLVVCQFAHSKKNASSQIGKWKRLCLANEKWEKYFRSPSLYLRHWSHTDLERYIYLKLAASIVLSLTKTHGYLIWYKLNILHPDVNVLYSKSNFLISIQYKT